MSGTATGKRSMLEDDSVPSAQSGMTRQFVGCLQTLGHSLLALVAALVAVFSFRSFVRPFIGRNNYRVLTQTPLMTLLMLTVIALWGIALYYRWRDRHAFFAWLPPALWCLCLLISRGPAAFESSTHSAGAASFFLEICAAYSAGAILSAVVVNTLGGKSAR